jgi:DNA-binding GntR family transcriptional regulator
MSSTLKQTAYKTIRSKLISGEYPPGSRLSDDSIAREIGVSRSPVREAINQFVSEGLVEYRPRCGTYVKTLSVEELDDLWGVRIALESFAAVEAVDSATERDIEGLTSVNAEILQLARTCRGPSEPLASRELKEEFLKLDSEFHVRMLRATGNQRLLKIVEDCRLMTFIFGSAHLRLNISAEMIVQCQRDHDLIVKAIRSADRDNAREWTANHIRAARARVIAASA